MDLKGKLSSLASLLHDDYFSILFLTVNHHGRIVLHIDANSVLKSDCKQFMSDMGIQENEYEYSFGYLTNTHDLSFKLL